MQARRRQEMDAAINRLLWSAPAEERKTAERARAVATVDADARCGGSVAAEPDPVLTLAAAVERGPGGGEARPSTGPE